MGDTREVKGRHSILIKPADKGNAVIIIDREQCVRGSSTGGWKDPLRNLWR